MSTHTLRSSDVIRQARSYLGLSQQDFGELIQRSQGVVSKYEKGTVRPNGDILIQCMNIIDAHLVPLGPLAVKDGWQAVHRAMAQLSAALSAVQQQAASR